MGVLIVEGFKIWRIFGNAGCWRHWIWTCVTCTMRSSTSTGERRFRRNRMRVAGMTVVWVRMCMTIRIGMSLVNTLLCRGAFKFLWFAMWIWIIRCGNDYNPLSLTSWIRRRNWWWAWTSLRLRRLLFHCFKMTVGVTQHLKTENQCRYTRENQSYNFLEQQTPLVGNFCFGSYESRRQRTTVSRNQSRRNRLGTFSCTYSGGLITIAQR